MNKYFDYASTTFMSDENIQLYGKLLDKYKYNLNEKGVIIIDNLDFHGYVFNSSSIKSRNLRQMVRKIEKFITYLKTQDEFSVEFIKVGDTIGVCKRKNL